MSKLKKIKVIFTYSIYIYLLELRVYIKRTFGFLNSRKYRKGDNGIKISEISKISK